MFEAKHGKLRLYFSYTYIKMKSVFQIGTHLLLPVALRLLGTTKINSRNIMETTRKHPTRFLPIAGWVLFNFSSEEICVDAGGIIGVAAAEENKVTGVEMADKNDSAGSANSNDRVKFKRLLSFPLFSAAGFKICRRA